MELSGDLDLAQEAAGPHSVRELGMEYFDGHSPTVTHVPARYTVAIPPRPSSRSSV